MLPNFQLELSAGEWAARPRAPGDPLYGDFALGEFVRTALIDDLRLDVTAHPAEAVVTEHSHPTPLLLLVLDGAMEESCEGRTTAALPGTVLMRPAGASHSVRFLRPTRLFSIESGPAWLESRGAASLVDGLRASEWAERHSWLALQVYRAFALLDTTPAAALILQGYLQALLGELVPPMEGGGVPLWLLEIRRSLDADLRQRLDLERLARQARVHPVHLSRTFRKHFGVTLTDYLRQGRLAAAMVRLSTTDAPIAAVARESGFADASHFAREFRRSVGDSPAGYRAGIRAKGGTNGRE